MLQDHLNWAIKKFGLEHLRNKPEELKAEIGRQMSLLMHERRKSEQMSRARDLCHKSQKFHESLMSDFQETPPQD